MLLTIYECNFLFIHIIICIFIIEIIHILLAFTINKWIVCRGFLSMLQTHMVFSFSIMKGSPPWAWDLSYCHAHKFGGHPKFATRQSKHVISSMLEIFHIRSLKHKVCGWSLVHSHILQLLPIGFTQEKPCCTKKYTMKHVHKPDWKLNLPWFSYDYQKCMFVDFLIEYTCPPNRVQYWVWSGY